MTMIIGSLGWILASTAGILKESHFLRYVSTSVAVVALLISLPLHMLIAHRVSTRRGLTRQFNGGEVNLSSIRKEYKDFRQRFDSAQIASFVELILDPRAFRGRVNEEIEVRRRVLRQNVVVSLDIPAEKIGKTLLIPVLRPSKGELQDDLTVMLDGEPMATLTYREYLIMITMIMDALLTPAPATLTVEEVGNLRRNAKVALKLVATRRSLNGDEIKKVNRCAKRITRLAPRAGESLVLAAVLLRRLANNYVIVGILPAGGEERANRSLSYGRYIIPSLKLGSLKALLGLLLGARPKHVSLDLSVAATAHSYHLLVMGPEGTYVGWQNLTDGTGLMESGSSREKLTRPYSRLRRRLGQRYLHLYLRSVPSKVARKLRLDIKFFEVPPGSMAGAALAAAANFALVLLISLIIPSAYTFNPAADNPLGSDFPALVLAFPAIAGAFVGYDNRSAALVGGMLSAKLSSMITVALSLAASGLFMAQQARVLREPAEYGVFGIRDTWWQIVTIVALLNALYAAYTWLARTLAYYWLAQRPDDQYRDGPSEH
ncbi:hypothetical protein [Amycolatopsis sp. w19]|uniref:hypothetical protein n=1 Tax=Amycolatopsis sp. w19 TaxID=3448134 RepID=UPI003F194241